MAIFSPGLAAYSVWSRISGPAWSAIFRRRLALGKEDPLRGQERFGMAGSTRRPGPLIWLHAASVGEAQSVLGLIDRLSEARCDVGFLLTTGTVSSARMLIDRLPNRTTHQYAPYDLHLPVRRFLDHWRPSVGIWTESEFWPRLMCETYRRNIPMLLVNARISERSTRHWRFAPGLAKALGSRFEKVYAQDGEIAARLRGIGFPASRIEVVGTLKQDAPPLPVDRSELDRFRKITSGRPVWAAASTHSGEEEIVAEAHAKILTQHPDAMLILAPRHPERAEACVEALAAHGIVVQQRSKVPFPDIHTQAYVADRLGEMGLWYRLASTSFVGGSLGSIGGHNPFEPARLNSALLSGPDMRNFAEIHRRLYDAGAIRTVSDATTMADAVLSLLMPGAATAQAALAAQVCFSDSSRSPMERTLQGILLHLPPSGPPP